MQHIESLDIEVDLDTLRVKSRETATREFKRIFDRSSIASYLKAMAAMANGDGGTIIFGVNDKPRSVVGIESEFTDEADLSNQIRNHFEPFIKFELLSEQISQKNVCAIRVFPALQKPVICKKLVTARRRKGNKEVDEVVLEDAAIYFRYSAKTNKIAHSELQKILTDRISSELTKISQTFEIIKKIGPQNVGIVDVGISISDQNVSALYVSAEAAKNLNFIKKGNLVADRSEGSPAFHIVGNVELRTGIEIPIPDSDRVLPTEAVSKLAKLFKNSFPEVFVANKKLNAGQLKKLACFYKLRGQENTGDHNTKYCFHDSKTGRFFYRKAFLDFIAKKVEAEIKEVTTVILNWNSLMLKD
jgi:Putative DNA-binding domain